MYSLYYRHEWVLLDIRFTCNLECLVDFNKKYNKIKTRIKITCTWCNLGSNFRTNLVHFHESVMNLLKLREKYLSGDINSSFDIIAMP